MKRWISSTFIILMMAGILFAAGGDQQKYTVTSAEISGQAKKPPGPEYLHNAVFYQIYPQTFLDTDGDGIGDLNGIIKKLDYIKSLGVDGVWINPFFKSNNSQCFVFVLYERKPCGADVNHTLC